MKVEIRFVDDSTEIVENVDDIKVRDDTLNLYQRGIHYTYVQHLGSYPLANVKRWRRVE